MWPDSSAKASEESAAAGEAQSLRYSYSAQCPHTHPGHQCVRMLALAGPGWEPPQLAPKSCTPRHPAASCAQQRGCVSAGGALVRPRAAIQLRSVLGERARPCKRRGRVGGRGVQTRVPCNASPFQRFIPSPRPLATYLQAHVDFAHDGIAGAPIFPQAAFPCVQSGLVILLSWVQSPLSSPWHTTLDNLLLSRPNLTYTGFSALKHKSISMELIEDNGPAGFVYRTRPSKPGARPSLLTFAAPGHVSIIEEDAPGVGGDVAEDDAKQVRPGSSNPDIRSGLVFYVYPTRPGWSRFHGAWPCPTPPSARARLVYGARTRHMTRRAVPCPGHCNVSKATCVCTNSLPNLTACDPGTSFIADKEGKPAQSFSIFGRLLPPWLNHLLGHTFLAGDDLHLHNGSKNLARAGFNHTGADDPVAQDQAVRPRKAADQCSWQPAICLLHACFGPLFSVCADLRRPELLTPLCAIRPQVLHMRRWLNDHAGGSPPWPAHMAGANPILANLDLERSQVCKHG